MFKKWLIASALSLSSFVAMADSSSPLETPKYPRIGVIDVPLLSPTHFKRKLQGKSTTGMVLASSLFWGEAPNRNQPFIRMCIEGKQVCEEASAEQIVSRHTNLDQTQFRVSKLHFIPFRNNNREGNNLGAKMLIYFEEVLAESSQITTPP